MVEVVFFSSDVSGNEAFVLATLSLQAISLESPALQRLQMRTCQPEISPSVYVPVPSEHDPELARIDLEIEQIASDAAAGKKRGGRKLDEAARRAVESLRQRANEDIDEWADKLAQSLADVKD